MYTPAQLANWGQLPPASACAKLAAATTLALALSAIPAAAQMPGGRTLTGTVMELVGRVPLAVTFTV